MNFSNKWCVLPVLVVLLSVGDVGAKWVRAADGSMVEVDDYSSKSNPLLDEVKMQHGIQKQLAEYRLYLRAAKAVKTAVCSTAKVPLAKKPGTNLGKYDTMFNDMVDNLENAATGSYTDDEKVQAEKQVSHYEQQVALLSDYGTTNDFYAKRLTKAKYVVMPGSSWYGKIFYGFIAMALENVGNAIDSQLEKTSNSIMKRFSRSMWNAFAGMGFISPLSAEQVDSWIHALERYRLSMDKLSSTSTQDSSFANTFAHRDKGRPEKQTAGKEDVAVEGETKKKKQIPAYVTITDVTVSQLSSQINYTLQSVDSSYKHQRSLLSDTLMILADIRARVVDSHEENQSPVLTQSLKNDFIALCDTAISELQSLLDILNIDKESSTETKSSSNSSKKPSDSRLFGRD